MNSRQLLHFRIIAKEENLQRAAEVLYVSPPALSKTIAELEDELGCKLFNRLGKKITLNENGRKLLQYAEEQYNLIEKVKMTFLREETVKPVIVSLYFLWYQVLFPNATSINASNYSTLLCDSDNVYTMYDKLLDGYADAIIDYDRNLYGKSDQFLQKYLLIEESYAVHADIKHPWAEREYLTLADIEGANFVDRQNNEVWRKEFMKYFNVNYSVIQQLESSTFTKALQHTCEPLLHMDLPGSSSSIGQNKRSIPIICKPRNVFLWWISENDKKVKPLIENIKLFHSNND